MRIVLCWVFSFMGMGEQQRTDLVHFYRSEFWQNKGWEVCFFWCNVENQILNWKIILLSWKKRCVDKLKIVVALLEKGRKKTCVLMTYTHIQFFGLFFYWRIIALQYCVGFCHTSTRISLRYTYVTSLMNLPPTSHPIPPSRLSQAPVWVPCIIQPIPTGYLFYIW